MGSLRTLKRNTDGQSLQFQLQDELIEGIVFGTVKDVEGVLKRGVNVNFLDEGDPAISVAAMYWKLSKVKLLVKHGANVNAKNEGGQTPLHYALSDWDKEAPKVVKFLLDNGAEVDATDNQGRTPLMEAASRGDVGSVIELFLKGADPGRKDNEGKTALDYVGDLANDPDSLVRGILTAKPCLL